MDLEDSQMINIVLQRVVTMFSDKKLEMGIHTLIQSELSWVKADLHLVAFRFSLSLICLCACDMAF